MGSCTRRLLTLPLLSFVSYMEEYFKYIGAEQLIPRILMKCITTKLAECFFGYVIQGVVANNLTTLEMKKRLTNDAFVYLMPYLNTEDSGISIRSEKARVETYSYSEHDLELGNDALIWKLRGIQGKLLSIEEKRRLKLLCLNGEKVNSQFTFGQTAGPVHLMSVIDSRDLKLDPCLD